MPSLFASALKLSARALEVSLTAVDTSAHAVRTGLDVITGRTTAPPRHSPPVDGPQNVETALADFVNQMVRIGWITSPASIPVRGVVDDLLKSAQRAFGYLAPADPRALLGLPFELPLSAAGIATETMLRMIAVYSVVGARRMPVFVSNAAEVYCETAVFIGLEYKQLIERFRERLAQHPGDYRTRIELGRMYIKCGLYDDAVRELDIAAQDPDGRARARHESALAHYRSGRYPQAVNDGIAALFADPENERARITLWLSAQALGGYPRSVPVAHRMELKVGYAPTRVRFENIAARIGLDKISAGRGTAVLDYNNDGLLDLVVTASHAGCTLFRNNGDGTFTDVSVGSGLDKCINAFVVISGDYDCDGFLDLFIAYNLGGMFDRRIQNRLFHNNGDGTFTDVTEKSGLQSVFTTIGSCWGDYNNDGFPDLFLSSGLGRPQLFRNNGDGTFTDVSLSAGLTDFLVGTTCFFADYDNDGWLDIVQYSWADHEDSVYTMRTGKGPEDGSPLAVYRNNRDGTFTIKRSEIGIDGCWGTMSGNYGDVNNDGYIDLLLGNGSPRMERQEPFILLENNKGHFSNTTFSAGLPFSGKSHGTNCADLFGDGRLSIIIAAGGGYPGDLLQTAVHCPKVLPGNYLNVRLRGTKSNRDGNGARITLKSGDLSQMREVTNGTSFGCLPLEQHFGLGERTETDWLEIRWPSGLRQRIENPPVNDTIRVIEGQPGWEPVYAAFLVAPVASSDASRHPEPRV